MRLRIILTCAVRPESAPLLEIPPERFKDVGKWITDNFVGDIENGTLVAPRGITATIISTDFEVDE